tara:strand:- start:728 stop:1681 length:954 start_codon:yes stop_codon:yes gene_type:complete
MNNLNQFYRASIITVILLYVLVLVGGFVRITESGDDCPDWPKCYGSWFPPLTIDDIPEEFNPSQKKVYGSWIEYFNRLVGVILGISMLFTFFKSFGVYKKDKILFYGSFLSLLLIIIAGWIGGQIATNIDGENIIFQHTVSIHLYIAILTTISLVYTTNRGFLNMYPNIEKDYSYSSFSKQLLIAIFFLNLFLVFTGSYIRTFIDDNLLKELDYFIRMEKYVTETGLVKYMHPVFGFTMLACSAILWNHNLNQSNPSNVVLMLTKLILYSICAQIIIGECLRFGMIHESFRLYHLWLSSVILGLIIVAYQRIKIASS